MLETRTGQAAENSKSLGLRPEIRVLLAAPRGFCAGVRRAIDAVEDALHLYGPPVYVRRAIVHNMAVPQSLEAKGAIFVQELAEGPSGAVPLLSAPGRPRAILADAERRKLRYYDAICPLVAKVHREVAGHHARGRHVVLIGHPGHPEIAGTLGQIPAGAATVIGSAADVEAIPLHRESAVAYAIQTTYSVDDAAEIVGALKRRFRNLIAPPSSDICYATTNRQAALKRIAGAVEGVIVVGERFSSNACRLVEVAASAGCRSAQLVANASEIAWPLLEGCRSVGITAAASTPEASVREIVAALRLRFDLILEESDAHETAVFGRVRVGRYPTKNP